ncbi:hypothetical protein VNN36_12125 (plasmid) [Lactococcus garvieae]|uniref:hypothetical protein n=1 Tax=Lactococcus garvieae TaxID=1363 RepID=UPI0030D5662D
MAASADTQETVVTAEIVEGDLSMSQPNDLTFSAVLKDQAQTIDLDPIHTTITDYRSKKGWELTVESSNFESYAPNYQLLVNDVAIDNTSKSVYINTDQSTIQAINLPVNVEISADAKTGSYTADLEWNLQPNTKHSLKE